MYREKYVNTWYNFSTIKQNLETSEMGSLLYLSIFLLSLDFFFTFILFLNYLTWFLSREGFMIAFPEGDLLKVEV